MSARQILEQYLLSQTSVNEYLPRNKMAAVTQLPTKLLDDLYAKIVLLDKSVQDEVRLDVSNFINELRSLVSVTIENARHTIVEERDQVDDVSLAAYGQHGTAIDEHKFLSLSEQVSLELERRANGFKSKQSSVKRAIEQIDADLKDQNVETQPQDQETLVSTISTLNKLSKTISNHSPDV